LAGSAPPILRSISLKIGITKVNNKRITPAAMAKTSKGYRRTLSSPFTTE